MIWTVLHWAARLFLGGIFVYAGYTKINWADVTTVQLQFSSAIEAYQLLPLWSVWYVTHYLPWIEVVLGMMILSGWKLRWFAAGGAGLLGSFIFAMAITYARGIDADCGCFGLGEKISPFTLLRDSLFMIPAVFLAWQAWRSDDKKTTETPPPPQAPATEQTA